jgi:hypothetical protein
MAVALDRALTGRRARPAVRAVARVTVLLASTAMLSVLVSDSVGGRFRREPGVAVDASGRIAVRVPDQWRAAAGSWAGPAEAGGEGGPALLVSPDPTRWNADATMPGAFVWLAGSAAAADTPTAFLARRPHAGCAADSRRDSRQAGIDWVVAVFRCTDSRGRLVEAAGTGPGGAGLVYVQIAPPPGSGPAFVDTLLAGVRVRGRD